MMKLRDGARGQVTLTPKSIALRRHTSPLPLPLVASSSPRRSAMPESSSASPRPYFPEWVLLDPIAHVAPLENATTADTPTSALFRIKVSFDVVDPPALSRCFVTSSELDADDVSVPPPLVIGADGAFVLIRVVFPARHGRWTTHTAVFVYKAGPGTPSIHLLPRPYPSDNPYFKHVGVLSCGDGHCLVVVPERHFDDGGRMRYDLQVFSTGTNLWTTRAARLAPDLEGYYGLLLQHEPTKAFSVGGDSLAWVDTYLGVLLCNVLSKDPEMQLIDLPPLMPTNKVDLGEGFVAPVRTLSASRDVVCKDGWIRCIEIEIPELCYLNPMDLSWRATIARRRILGSDKWKAFVVDSARLLPTNSCFPDLFPEIWDSNKDKLTLNKLLSTSPILDAYHDNAFFMKSKLDTCSRNGWILSVHARDKKLVRVAPFSARKVYFNHTYMQCGFSKHLSKALETHATIVSTEKISREVQLPFVAYVFSILTAQQQLMQFGESLSQKRSSYLEARSVLHSGVRTTLYLHIQELAQYATSNGLGEVATDAVAVFLRAYKEVDNLLQRDLSNDPSRDESLRDNISIAIGALNSLLQTLPSQVLRLGRSALVVACMDESVGEQGTTEKLLFSAVQV